MLLKGGNFMGEESKQLPENTQLPGGLLKINIPGGALINLLDLLEVASPDGINLVVRSPKLGVNHENEEEASANRGSILDVVRKAKAVIDVLND
jgi:hypothetical protein